MILTELKLRVSYQQKKSMFFIHIEKKTTTVQKLILSTSSLRLSLKLAKRYENLIFNHDQKQ